MNINNINNSTNFKSTYPVVHWVAEANGSYAPISNLKLVKKLQSKLVRVLNKPLNETTKIMNVREQNIRAYAGRCDIDYRNKPIVRSFYNRKEASIDGSSPVVYVISGKDIEPFETQYAKNIGVTKTDSIKNFDNPYSIEAKAAIDAYNLNGLNFVNNNDKRIKNSKGMTYVLHTKFMIIRNKLGKIKDYILLDARFLPERGPDSPFERLKR